jgi:hypothetical protein
MLERVGVDCLRGAAVDGEVGLAVALEVEARERDPTVDRVFEESGCHIAPFPAHVRGRPTFTETTRMAHPSRT